MTTNARATPDRRSRTAIAVRVLTDAFVYILGFLTFAYWFTVLWHGTFAQLTIFGLCVVPVALFAGARWSTPAPAESDPRELDFGQLPPMGSFALVISLIAGAASPLGIDAWLIWLLLTGAAVAVVATSAKVPAREPHRCERLSSGGGDNVGIAALAGLIALAMLVTVVAHRPDADDEAYLIHLFDPLRLPNVPFQSLPSGLWRTGYSVLSYQTIEALFAHWLGWPSLAVYYWFAPAACAAMVVLANFRFLSACRVKSPELATLAVLVVLLSWGDTHRAPGNFAFVRLFQAKAVFAAVLMPMILTYAVEMLAGNRNAVVSLSVAIAAAVGATQTAFVLLPIFVVSLGAALVIRDPLPQPRNVASVMMRMAHVAIGLSPVLVPFGVALAVFLQAHQGAQMQPDGIRGSAAISYVLGGPEAGWIRAAVGLLSCLIWPLLLSPKLRLPAAVLMAGVLALVMNPLVAAGLNTISASASWRVWWILPLAQATALVIIGVSANVARALPARRFVQPLVFIAVMAAYILAGRTTVQPSNGVRLAFPSLKLPSQAFVVLRQLGNARYPISSNRICMGEKDTCY